MPRSLTEQEKEGQRQLLLKHGRNLLIRYGISRISVDDIVREAGMAKGSFYNYFSSKDAFLYEILLKVHLEGFAGIKNVASEIVDLPSQEKKERIKKFFHEILNNPEQRFFLNERNESERFLLRYSRTALADLEALEVNAYQELLQILNIQGKQPEIVQNYVHIVVFGVSYEELLTKEYIDSTVDVLIDGLLHYLEV